MKKIKAIVESDDIEHNEVKIRLHKDDGDALSYCGWVKNCDCFGVCCSCPAENNEEEVTHKEALEWWNKQEIED